MVKVMSQEWQDKMSKLKEGLPPEYDTRYMGKPELSGNVTWDMVPDRMKQGYRLLKGKGKNEVVILWLRDFEKFTEAVIKYKQKYL